MASQDYQPILLQAQLGCLRDDLDNLLAILASPQIPATYAAMLVGRFKTIISPLLHQLQAVQARVQRGEYRSAWEELGALQRSSRHLREEALEFLGGIAVRQTALDRGLGEIAHRLALHYATQAGVDWAPSVIIGRRLASDWPEETVVAEDPGDSLVRLPIPRWDVWYLPLLAHDYGYWVAKRGHKESFDRFVAEGVAVVKQLLDEPPPSAEQVAPLLPEIRQIWDARTHAGDLQEFRERNRSVLERLTRRQQVHLWHLVADAFATYFVGPAYAYALLFLTLDPTRPDLEGEQAGAAGDGRSRYLPADARRMAVVLHILRQMDKQARTDDYTPGPYSPDLRWLEAVWEDALELAGNLDRYRHIADSMAGWGRRLYDGLELHFGLQARETLALWQRGNQELGPVLQNGADAPFQPEPWLVINAAWSHRPRYPHHLGDLSRYCEQLLAGDHSPIGLHTSPPAVEREAERLLHSRLYDLETDLQRLVALFSAGEIEQADRDAVAGRFYRLLSEQDYKLRGLQQLVTRRIVPLSSSLSETMKRSQGWEIEALQREQLDFLGGILIRGAGLDQGLCGLAEALLRYFARRTGVNWASRAILGVNPLFSLMSDMIHVRFPDRDIWNLPLMAHEFGHVTAFATPAFSDLLADESRTCARGHPEAGAWDEGQIKAFAEIRGNHLHEFFADAFAVYCLGPAFAYNTVFLHFNPVEAYRLRGNHPAHAERVEVILKVLEEVNNQAKRDDYDPGPYAGVLGRLAEGWAQAVEKAEAKPDNTYQFYQRKAGTLAGKIYHLLDRYYRLGAQYQAGDWTRADQVASRLLSDTSDLSGESLRDLLNIAWACRVRHPDRLADIARLVRQHLS